MPPIPRAPKGALPAILATLAACAPGAEPVAVRVASVGSDPFLGADHVALELSSGSRTIAELELPGSAREFVLGPIPWSEGLVLGIETRLGTLPLARGRSLPFAVGPGGVVGSPDVTIGVLGRHGLVGSLVEPVLAVIPTAAGAILCTATSLVPFFAHGPDGRPLVGPAVPLPAALGSATFVPLDGGVLAVGDGSATLFSGEGAILAELGPGELAATSGVALAALGPLAVVAVGGLDRSGAALDEVVRIERTELGLAAASMPRLPSPRGEARAFLVSAMSRSGPTARVLVEGGLDATGPVDSLVVLDPEGASATVSWAPPIARHGAAIVGIEVGQVLFSGGALADGTPLATVDLLFVDVDRPLSFYAPEPPLLFRARTEAEAVPLGPGIALVLGGRDGGGAAIDASELLDLRVLPGRVALTGALPGAGSPTRAAPLPDGSILVASGSALTLYFPPLP